MRWSQSLPCLLLLAVFSFFFALVKADDVVIQKRAYNQELEEAVYDPKKKKPFCNAFTGCGRKRSDESMPLIDLNAEPVEEISRQILSEAKLWEAIQEARLELLKKHAALEKLQNARLEAKGLPFTMMRRRRTSYKPY
ncbi:unnamed protein product [Bemisia tabaci]|uniref:Cardioactive peptide n=1 Tax=Bemisia tabaci TaxID=7038 RepID=A0A9P0F9E1_BEMTA|nr:unnamed protein product [Bemisia tabaci]